MMGRMRLIVLGVLVLAGCQPSDSEHATAARIDSIVAVRVRAELQRREDAARDSAQQAAVAVAVARAEARKVREAAVVRPCDRPRPYRDWTNAEISTALVETMGTDASLPFIAEGACR